MFVLFRTLSGFLETWLDGPSSRSTQEEKSGPGGI